MPDINKKHVGSGINENKHRTELRTEKPIF
jgi:hypothetical protein